MKSVKLYIHLLWMFLLTSSIVASAQNSFNPLGYASSLKEASLQPLDISTLSIYYTNGLVFDVDKGKYSPDAAIETISTLKNLKTLRLNGCPVGFKQDKFFCNLGRVKNLQALELRMNFKKLGALTEESIDCLKKLKNLKRINLPHDYPLDKLKELQEALPVCELVINVYPEGE